MTQLDAGELISAADADGVTSIDAGRMDGDSGLGTRDAGVDPRWPPLPECPLRPGQTRREGADSPEGTVAMLPGQVYAADAGRDVAAFLHQNPWRLSEARPDRTPLLHAPFEEPAGETEPFRTDVDLRVAGDGTIWLQRTDWESLDEHGRSLRPIGRQVVAIYCGVETVHVRLDRLDEPHLLWPAGERRVGPGIPIATPDGATLMEMPDGEVRRFFAGESELFLPAGESLGAWWQIGGRLFLRIDRAEGETYLAEYDGEPVTSADAVVEAVQVIEELEEPVFCGESEERATLFAPSPDGRDERVALVTDCPRVMSMHEGQRWLYVQAPAEGSGFYSWNPGERPVLRVPVDEELRELQLYPHASGGFLTYYDSNEEQPRYRLRYADLTQTTELGSIDASPRAIQSGRDYAHFITGQAIVWLTENARFDQRLDGLWMSSHGSSSNGEGAPDGALWVTVRVRNDGSSPNRSRLLRVFPREAPEIVLDEIESAWFGWHDGFGYGEVRAYDERYDAVAGLYFVEGASRIRRVARGGFFSAYPLSEVDGNRWLLYGDRYAGNLALANIQGGVLTTRLEGVAEIKSAVRDAAGQTWFISTRPDGSQRVARVAGDSVDVMLDLPREVTARFFDARGHRGFSSQPWGVLVRRSLCGFQNLPECIPLPDHNHTVITASGWMFSWQQGAEETTLWSRRVR